jgi:DNA-binding transcriptional ArsR family regulator
LGEDWQLLSVFESEVRVEIVKALLASEFQSLSQIAEKLKNRGLEMTLPAVTKHMKELEKTGIVRQESGVFAKKPDARKTIYFLEGRERIERLMGDLETAVLKPLHAGAKFYEAAQFAREMQKMDQRLTGRDRKRFEALLRQCESDEVYTHLTEDEKKKLKLWRMMMSIL